VEEVWIKPCLVCIFTRIKLELEASCWIKPCLVCIFTRIKLELRELAGVLPQWPMAAVEALCVTCLVEETIWLGFLLSVFVGVPLRAGAGAMRMFHRGRSPGLGLPEPRAVLPVLPELPESKNVTVIPAIPAKTAATCKLLPRAVVTKLRVFTPLLSLTALAFSLLAMGKNPNLGGAYDLCCICASI